MPDVRARPAVAPQFNVVEVCAIADTEDADEFVLAAVKRALSGIGLDPHRHVQRLAVDRAAGLEQLADMTPVHAYEVDGAVAGYRRRHRERLRQEGDKARARELTGCHREFGVLDATATDDIADANVVGRIEERHGGAVGADEPVDGVRIPRITAQDAVTAQFPEIARLAHSSGRGPCGVDGVSRIGGGVLEVRCELVDLDRRKAGDRDVEAINDQDLRELGQLGGQELAVPAGVLADLIVGKRERTPLGLG